MAAPALTEKVLSTALGPRVRELLNETYPDFLITYTPEGRLGVLRSELPDDAVQWGINTALNEQTIGD